MWGASYLECKRVGRVCSAHSLAKWQTFMADQAGRRVRCDTAFVRFI